jgi:MFS family permease
MSEMMPQKKEEKLSGYRWVMLGLVFAETFLVFGFVWSSQSPLLSSIARDLNLSHFQLGLIVSAVPITLTGLPILGGVFADRFGIRTTTLVGLILASIGGILRGFASSFEILFILAIVIGTGLSFLVPTNSKFVRVWFSPKKYGTITGIIAMGYSTGTAATMILTAAFLLPWLGSWKNVFLFVGILALFGTIIWGLLAREKKMSSPKQDSVFSREGLLRLLKIRDVWLISGCEFFQYGSIVALSGFLPYILESQGLKPVEAAGAASTYMWALAIGALSLPALSDRLGRKVMIIPFTAVSAIIVYFLGTATGLTLWVLLFLLGLFLGGIPATVLVMPLEIEGIGMALVGTVMGLVFGIGHIGGILIPIAIGLIVDIFHSFTPVFTFVALMIALIIPCVFPVKEKRGRAKV